MRSGLVADSQATIQDGTTHLDGPPRLKLDDLVASFRPFSAPPPPQPFEPDQKPAAKKASEKKRTTKKKTVNKYGVHIELTETIANGESTWTASSSPAVPIPEPRKPRFQEVKRERELQSWKALRQRMLEQTDASQFVRKAPTGLRKYKMLLISVKRQRKLKMKKHKYKKLMKRTRNLRRRQDRA